MQVTTSETVMTRKHAMLRRIVNWLQKHCDMPPKDARREALRVYLRGEVR